MMRRGFVSFSNLQLGPPLRAENDEEEVDGCGDAPEEPPKPLTSSQQVHVHTRGLNEGYSQSWWLLQANKENVKTPVTFPRASESYRSANNSVDRGLPLQTDTAQETPSSTCPAFWNPGDATGETNRPVGRKLLTRPPPSSNLPESSPALPSCKSDTRQGPTFHSHRVPHCVSVTTAAATKEEPDCKTLPREDGPPSEYAMSDSKGTFGSVSKQLDPIPRHPTSKPPIDYSSTRRNSKTTPNPKKVLFTSPEKRDVVIMPSPSGEERKFRKLALVGCGGSSKVCVYICTCSWSAIVGMLLDCSTSPSRSYSLPSFSCSSLSSLPPSLPPSIPPPLPLPLPPSLSPFLLGVQGARRGP